MSHFRNVCEYGRTHGQCRCANKDKEVREVVCNMPNSHSPSDSAAKTDPVETIAVRTAWIQNEDCPPTIVAAEIDEYIDEGTWPEDRKAAADRWSEFVDPEIRDLTVLFPRAAVEAMFAAADPVAVEVEQ